MCRIFLPPDYDLKGEGKPRLPVLFTIHGGGFISGSPLDCHHLDRIYARDHGLLVLSLDYDYAPHAPFPKPVHDVAALVTACLSDATLPIDHARVTLMGWSAGGNLALAAAQLPALQGRIRSVIPMYPVVDWTTRVPQKLETRQWKPSLGGFRSRPSDYLELMAPLSEWAYLPGGQDVRDPLLSPTMAPAGSLPPNLFFVGAEMDMLAHEAWVMACSITGRKAGDRVGRSEGSEEGQLVLNDERFYWDHKEGPRRTGWLLVPDVVHGFDMDLSRVVRDPTAMEDARKKTDKVVELIATWIKDVNSEADGTPERIERG